jgi:hypothetical protein
VRALELGGDVLADVLADVFPVSGNKNASAITKGRIRE